MSNGEKVQRYAVELAGEAGCAFVQAHEDDAGEWVKHADYAAQASTIVALKEQIEALQASLGDYANPKNWTMDDEQIARVWLEPGSSTPTCYAGFELANNALASQPTAPVQPEREAVPGKSAVFAVDILGNPMREYAPGKWENCAWPSDAALTVGEAVNMGDFMTFYDHTPERMIPATLGGWVDSVDLERAINSRDKTIDELRQALATTRPSAALTEQQIAAAGRALADRSAEACNVDKEDNWKIYGNDFIEDARIALAASGGAVAVPEGFVVVPVDPTDEMLRVSLAIEFPGTYGAFLRHPSNGPRAAADAERDIEFAKRRYAAMISAAPAIPAQGQTK